jgi:hypothetical protein
MQIRILNTETYIFLQCSSYNTPLYDLPIDAAINQDLMDTGKEIHGTD